MIFSYKPEPESRICGGTPHRLGKTYEDFLMKYDGGKPGCGSAVQETQIRQTDPEPVFDGGPPHRPLFAKTAAVVICPVCDSAGPLADDNVIKAEE